jgi:hypothetical protein
MSFLDDVSAVKCASEKPQVVMQMVDGAAVPLIISKVEQPCLKEWLTLGI